MPNATAQIIQTVTDAATCAFDFSVSRDAKVTLGGSRTFTFTGALAGDLLTVIVIQDATGSRLVTFPATVKWAGGTAPTLTTTASKQDHFYFRYDGTNYYEVSQKLNF